MQELASAATDIGWIAFGIFIVLGTVIMVHELGHALCARALGARVEAIAFGFGPIIARWKSKRAGATEWRWCLLPIGGYAKIEGLELEIENDNDDQPAGPGTETTLTRGRRIAIYLAGPAANFVLAFVAMLIVAILPRTGIAPTVGTITPGGLADQAGLRANDRIVSINDTDTELWWDVRRALTVALLTQSNTNIALVRDGQHIKTRIEMPVLTREQARARSMRISTGGTRIEIGMTVRTPDGAIRVHRTNGAAQAAGIRSGDVIAGVDGAPIAGWDALIARLRQIDGGTAPARIRLWVERNGVTHTIDVEPPPSAHHGERVLGVRAELDAERWAEAGLIVRIRRPAGETIGYAANAVADLTTMTAGLLGRIVTGTVSHRTLSGPVGIVHQSQRAARAGASILLYFIAAISVSVGIVNLLPIPLLDGGRVSMEAVSAWRKRPVTNAELRAAARASVIVICGLLILTLVNDLERLLHL